MPHWQVPPLQLSAPMASEQGGLVPQAQRPSAPHSLVVRASHAVHAAALTPHEAGPGVTQVFPFEQQPVQPSQPPTVMPASSTETGFSTPLTTTTRPRPSASTVPWCSPRTSTSMVFPSSESGNSTRTTEMLGSGPAATSGRRLAGKISVWASRPLYSS